MMNAASTLRQLITEEDHLIKTTLVKLDNPILACIDFLRQIDVFSIDDTNKQNISVVDKVLIQERYRYGWVKPICELLKLSSSRHVFYPNLAIMENQFFVDSVIQVSGKLELCERFIKLEEAGLVLLSDEGDNRFKFRYKHDTVELERFERESYAFVRNVLANVVKEKFLNHIKKKNKIQREIKKIVLNPLGQFISYHTTPEIDKYYAKLGYFHLVQSHGYEEFSESDSFGGILYKEYLDFAENLMGIALKHMDCCFSLLQRNPKTNPYNIFTYTWKYSDTVKSFSDYWNFSKDKAEQIISCFTLSKMNVDFYNNESGLIPPPYFLFPNDILTRSIYGCLNGAIPFLKKELKRKYEKDYFVAVNNREKRFRADLYSFFPNPRLVKINKEVIIKVNNSETDLDAIIFDPSTKTLGLFQLKWQDPFGASLKERYSRISNTIPKSVEWIDKVISWIDNNDQKYILQRLGLQDISKEIGDVYLFVISRNHIHFTGEKLDGRAAWGSWYQLIHSFAKIKTVFDDPIRELYVKLLYDSPLNKVKRQGLPQLYPIKIELERFSLSYEAN